MLECKQCCYKKLWCIELLNTGDNEKESGKSIDTVNGNGLYGPHVTTGQTGGYL